MTTLFLKRTVLLLTGGRKRRFGTAGLINVFVTNLTLQALLFFGMKVGAATLISQATNAVLGYFLYSKYTFYHVSFNKSQASLRYGVMFMLLWLCNWAGIQSFSMLGISKNAGALLMIAPLACISYLTQKSWIFIEK